MVALRKIENLEVSFYIIVKPFLFKPQWQVVGMRNLQAVPVWSVVNIRNGMNLSGYESDSSIYMV